MKCLERILQYAPVLFYSRISPFSGTGLNGSLVDVRVKEKRRKDNMQYMLKKFREKLPICSCIAVIVSYLLIFHLSAIPVMMVLHQDFAVQLASMLIADVFVLAVFFAMGFGDVLAQKSRGILYSIGTGGYMIMVGAVAAVSNLAMYGLTEDYKFQALAPAGDILLFILAMLGIGFTEELVFRGIVTSILKDKFSVHTDKGIFLVIVLQGALFGACHMTNILSGIGLESALVQSIMASFLGMLLGAVYLRTNSLWFVMLLHAWNDFGALLAAGLYGDNTITGSIDGYTWRNLAGIPAYLVVVLILLRSSKRREIKDGRLYPAPFGIRIAKGIVLTLFCAGFLVLAAVSFFLTAHQDLLNI